MPKQDHKTPQEVIDYYATFDEANRLFSGVGQLERVRTQELIARYAPPPPAIVFDVGGGSGVYARWLANMGYEVYLVDASPIHVEQAREAEQGRGGRPLTSIAVGDACALARDDESVNIALLLGPLYHLPEREARVIALREAHRILQPGGVLLAVVISRFASTLVGLFEGALDDPEFSAIAARDRVDGQHRNPNRHPNYFTTAFFHHPDEFKAEMADAGFKHEATLGIEGPGWLLQNFEEHWNDEGRRERLLDVARLLEQEPSLLGIGPHLMGVARKTSGG